MTTAINPTTSIDRLYILPIIYENTMVFESPIETTIVQAKDFEKAKSKFLDKFNEFVEWSILVVINQESEVIDFSGDSKYYQESFMNKYPGIEL